MPKEPPVRFPKPKIDYNTDKKTVSIGISVPFESSEGLSSAVGGKVSNIPFPLVSPVYPPNLTYTIDILPF